MALSARYGVNQKTVAKWRELCPKVGDGRHQAAV